MDLTKDAIEKIASLCAPTIVKAGLREYTDKPLTLIKPPAYDQHAVHTLSGLVALAKLLNGPEEQELMVVVDDHARVVVRLARYGANHESPVLVQAVPAPFEGFPFNRYLSAEEFSIMLMTRFVLTDKLQALWRLASSLTSSEVYTSEDDGITQTTTLKKGAATRAVEKIESVWVLNPFRIFHELSQPASPFLFRLKYVKDQLPQCALYETDGGAWCVAAHQAIEAYLRDKLGPDFLIVA